MFEQALQRFCDSRYRWIIVITVTLLIGCGLLLPLVYVYSAQQAEVDHLALELTQARQTARDIEKFEARVAERLSRLGSLQSRMISQDGLADFRNRIVQTAREAGCQLRRIQVGAVHQRPWYENDNPLVQSVDKSSDLQGTPFVLKRWPVTIALTGSITNLRSLLTRMDSEKMLMHTRSLELSPTSRGRKESALDMELWYFALERST